MIALTLAGQTTYRPETELDEAMRLYWTAHSTGDATAALARIADDAVPATPVSTTPAGALSALAAERVARQDTWLREAGFAVEPPLFTPGTRVRPIGDRNFHTERRRVEALPTFVEATARITSAVQIEGRQDHVVDLRDLRVLGDGTIQVGDQRFALERPAFEQLAQLGGFGMGARYLTERCSAHLRATNVNAQFARTPERRLVLRTRQSDQVAQVYAVVTPTYTPVDTDTVLHHLAPQLADARVEMVYNGAAATATALWMPDAIVDLAAGDIFKAGVRVETDDTGRGRVRVSAVVFRNRCLNLIIIGEGTAETCSAVHKGDASSILTRVRAGVESARGKVSHFLEAWGHARTVIVDPMAKLRELVYGNKLSQIGTRDQPAVLSALTSAWQTEPGNTLADVANAVTRAAHEQADWSWDFRSELESRAAQLIYVPR